MKKAFTLLEVLITIMLMTLLMSSAMFSFKFFLDRLDKTELSLPHDAMSYEYINRVISGLYFYPVEVIKNFKLEDEYFFKTTSTSFSFITSTPIFYDRISVAKVEYKDNKLIYYESKLYSKEQDFKNPKILAKDFSYLLKKDIKNFKIKYSFYKKTNIPKNIELTFDNSEKWIFMIISNNIKYKSILKNEMDFFDE
jgi:prepilin-type N-terminal cleavage/methylation domain-containing protein